MTALSATASVPTPRPSPRPQAQSRVTKRPDLPTPEAKEASQLQAVQADIPPGAGMLTLGLALILGSGFFLAIGFMRWVDYTLGESVGSGMFWIFFGSMIQLAGYVAVVIGISRFARRADAAFGFLREQHEEWREERVADHLRA